MYIYDRILQSVSRTPDKYIHGYVSNNIERKLKFYLKLSYCILNKTIIDRIYSSMKKEEVLW